MDLFILSGEAHAPSGCKQWQEWHQKISEVKPEELKASCSGTEDAANCLWLVTNSKPCPNCKSPIQKNEGCNHMKCSKVISNLVLILYIIALQSVCNNFLPVQIRFLLGMSRVLETSQFCNWGLLQV